MVLVAFAYARLTRQGMFLECLCRERRQAVQCLRQCSPWTKHVLLPITVTHWRARGLGRSSTYVESTRGFVLIPSLR